MADGLHRSSVQVPRAQAVHLVYKGMPVAFLQQHANNCQAPGCRAMSLARHTTETNIALCHLTPTQMSIQTYNAVTRTMQSHTSLLPCLRQLKCPQIWPTACSCMSCGVKPHELIAASSTSGSSPFVYDSAHRAGVRRQHKQTCLFLHQRSDKSRTDHDVTAAVELSADVDLGERRPL